MRNNKTVDDLSDEEYENYERNPDKYEDITANTYDMYEDIIYPDGRDD